MSNLPTSVKDFIIPAYNFYTLGLREQKSIEEQEEYINLSVLITGSEIITTYLARQLESHSVDDTVQLVFGAILNNPEALNKLDVVCDGSYRCNRLLYNPITGYIELTGGNLSNLENTKLGSHMYYGEYPLTEEGVLSWIKGNERIFIQESYRSDFMDEFDDYPDDRNVHTDEESIDPRPDPFYDEWETERLVLKYVEEKVSAGLVPFYSDDTPKALTTLEEYNEILKSNGYSQYIF